MQKKVTLKQIAELANTSIGTVDRALNNRGRINEETKERILKLAKELNYAPNIMASSLSKKSEKRIGIVMSSEPEEFCIHLRHGIQDALEEDMVFGVRPEFIFSKTLSVKDQMDKLNQINRKDYDAFLVNAGSDQVGDWIKEAVNDGQTVVTFNTDAAESGRLCYVGEDPRQAGILIGTLLCEIIPNPRKILLMQGFEANFSHVQRCAGVREAVLAAYPSTEFLEEEYQDDPRLAREITRSLLEKYRDIDAVFASSATGVWGVGHAVSELKKEDRPKVFGYDVSMWLAELMDLDLCQGAIFQDPYWQGYYGAKKLIEGLTQTNRVKRDKYYIRSKIVLKSNVREYMKDKRQCDEYLL